MITDKSHIQKLLDRYMQSETTLDEERLLKDYFASCQNIPGEWKAFEVLFKGMAGRRTISANCKRKAKTAYLWIAAAAASIVAVVMLMPDRQQESIDVAENFRTVACETANTVQSSLPEDKIASAVQEKCIQAKTVIEYTATGKADNSQVSAIAVPVSLQRSATEIIPDLSEDEMMAQYIEDNFVTIEEKMHRSNAENVLSAYLDADVNDEKQSIIDE